MIFYTADCINGDAVVQLFPADAVSSVKMRNMIDARPSRLDLPSNRIAACPRPFSRIRSPKSSIKKMNPDQLAARHIIRCGLPGGFYTINCR